MNYTKEFDINEFEFWSGAKDWFNDFKQADMLDILAQRIEEVFEGKTPSDTDINDYVWFDDDLHDLLEENKEDNDANDNEDGGDFDMDE